MAKIRKVSETSKYFGNFLPKLLIFRFLGQEVVNLCEEVAVLEAVGDDLAGGIGDDVVWDVCEA